MTTAIPTDADLDGADNAADEFFKRLVKDAPEPSNDDEGEDTEDTTNEEAEETDSDEDSPESDDDGDEGGEGSDDTDEAEDDAEPETEEDDDSDTDRRKTVIDSEDAVVKIKVDGEEIEASIKDLKRLYGQEASLTRKSQEAAELRRRSEEAGALHVAGLESLLDRARKQAEPYQKLNFLALAKDPSISAEELSALSEAAQSAFDNVRFLESELGNVIQYSQEQRRAAMVTQARETIKVLSDPKTGIEGWSESLYNDIRSFAVEQGIPQPVVDEIVDPVGIKILHMAMKYAKGQKAVTTKTSAPKKIDKTPKKIVKGEPSETVRKAKATNKSAAIKKLAATGSTDDAAEAFLSRWSE